MASICNGVNTTYCTSFRENGKWGIEVGGRLREASVASSLRGHSSVRQEGGPTQGRLNLTNHHYQGSITDRQISAMGCLPQYRGRRASVRLQTVGAMATGGRCCVGGFHQRSAHGGDL